MQRKRTALCVEDYLARAVSLFLDADAHGIVGQDVLDEFGPLDEAE
jgi:hypothetical protein